MSHRAALALATLATVGLTAGGSAFGRAGTNIDLTIKTISETRAQYKGKIRSDNPDCLSGRLIKVKSRQTRLVKTRSDDEGRFDEIGRRPESGDPLKLKVVAKGDCDALIETGTAE